MAAVVGGSEEWRPVAPTEAGRAANDAMAAHMLDKLTAAKPEPDGFVPHLGMPGGADITLKPQLFTAALVGPDLWPTESESHVKQTGDAFHQKAQSHGDGNQTAKGQSDQVFSGPWTAGDGFEGASAHYEDEYHVSARRTTGLQAAGDFYMEVADDIRTAKTNMRAAHDEAHEKIEEALKCNAGRVVNVAPILGTYRSMIQTYSTELHGYVGDALGRFFQATGFNSNNIPQSPAKNAGNGGIHKDPPPDVRPDKDLTQLPQSPFKNAGDGGIQKDPPPDVRPDKGLGGSPPGPGGKGGIAKPAWAPGLPNVPTPRSPSLPSIGGVGAPSLGGGGGIRSLGGNGIAPLSGMFGRGLPTPPVSSLPTPPVSSLPTPAVQSQGASAMGAAVGEQFGHGLSAGSGIASAASASPPVPQAPSAPLAAPPGLAAPEAAIPAAASTPPPAVQPSAPAAAAPAAGNPPMNAPMTSFGSVLPPAPPAASTVVGSAGGAVAPSVPASAAVSGPGSSAGFLPVREAAPPSRPSRDVSWSDLELARSVVADLAAASSVVAPGLAWAVGVGRGTLGAPDLWIATNEGAGYIPEGVFVPRTMALAAGFDADFDARWFGWMSPAETVWRALVEQGLAVSAVATSWGAESEELRAAVPDVAFGVPAVGGPGDADASRLTRGRSHRLETVAHTLYQEMSRAESAVVDAYCRELTARAAFHAGPELSATAQAVARDLVSGRWPSAEVWQALRTEFSTVQVMAGSQRPGLIGVEDPAQMLRYHGEYVTCRRLETLLAWDSGQPADIVYAARAAGVVLPFGADLTVC